MGGRPRGEAGTAMSSGLPPPRYYMSMGTRTSDADEGGVPQWVWIMVVGFTALAAAGLALYYMANPYP